MNSVCINYKSFDQQKRVASSTRKENRIISHGREKVKMHFRVSTKRNAMQNTRLLLFLFNLSVCCPPPLLHLCRVRSHVQQWTSLFLQHLIHLCCIIRRALRLSNLSFASTGKFSRFNKSFVMFFLNSTITLTITRYLLYMNFVKPTFSFQVALCIHNWKMKILFLSTFMLLVRPNSLLFPWAFHYMQSHDRDFCCRFFFFFRAHWYMFISCTERAYRKYNKSCSLTFHISTVHVFNIFPRYVMISLAAVFIVKVNGNLLQYKINVERENSLLPIDNHRLMLLKLSQMQFNGNSHHNPEAV